MVSYDERCELFCAAICWEDNAPPGSAPFTEADTVAFVEIYQGGGTQGRRHGIIYVD